MVNMTYQIRNKGEFFRCVEKLGFKATESHLKKAFKFFTHMQTHTEGPFSFVLPYPQRQESGYIQKFLFTK